MEGRTGNRAEDGTRYGQQDSLPCTWCPDDLLHRQSLAHSFLILKSLLNLFELGEDDFVIHVSVGVCLSQNSMRFLATALEKEPSWRLWYKRQDDDAPDTANSLDQGWNSPGPGRIHE